MKDLGNFQSPKRGACGSRNLFGVDAVKPGLLLRAVYVNRVVAKLFPTAFPTLSFGCVVL